MTSGGKEIGKPRPPLQAARMAVEIERKFLVRDDSWQDGSPGIRMSQGYLCADGDRTVRIRIAGPKAWLTIKGRTVGIARPEFEYAVPPDEAAAMLAMCLPGAIEKTRHRIPHGSHVWEVDVFHGANEGLVVAEVELADDAEEPMLPSWIGDEVSGDSRYFNSALAREPFTGWK